MANNYFNKKKNHWLFLSLTGLALLLTNISVYAASFASLFTLAKNDQSIRYLEMIFGKMNGLLSSSDVTTVPVILAKIFGTFNKTMLCLAVIVVMYTVIMSIVNTAHQGEFLGKKLDSLWVPIRSIVGIIVIIPTKSGYSIIQLIMMWTVVQGIGAADQVWNTALVYMDNITGVPVALAPNKSTFTNFGSQIQNKAVCLYKRYQQDGGSTSFNDPDITLDSGGNTALNASFTDVAFKSSQSTGDGSNSTDGTSSGSSSQDSSVYFNGYNFNCFFPGYAATSNGSIATGTNKAAPHTPDCVLFANQSRYNKSPYYDSSKPSTDQSNIGKSGAITVNCGIIKWPSSSNKDAEKNYSMTSELDKDYATAVKDIFTASLPDAKINAYYNTPLPPSTAANNPVTEKVDAFYKVIKSYQGTEGNKEIKNQAWQNIDDLGWIMAGSYYYNIAQVSNLVDSIGDLSNLTGDPGSGDSSTFAGEGATAGTNWQDILTSSGGTGILNSIVELFRKMVTGSWSNEGFINNEFNYNQDGKPVVLNPIITIQLLGTRIVTLVEEFFKLGLTFILGMALISGICPSVSPFKTVFAAISRFVLVPVMFGMGLLFTIGLTMQVYIPMIPYIIFFFAAMGWLIGVIETILAAPLVALGITHPEGHEVYGRAEPALMLLVNVFVRPTFMVIGLLVGILLSVAAVTLLNFSFGQIMGSTASGTGVTVGPIQSIFYLVIYISLVIAILNKSFGLITTISDHVLRFIGNQHQLGSEQGSGEQETKQAFGGATGAASQIHGAATSKLSGDSEKRLDGASQEKAQKKKPDIGGESKKPDKNSGKSEGKGKGENKN